MTTDKIFSEHDIANPKGRPARSYSVLLWLLSFMFAARVFCQVLQHWNPQSYLPPFDAFQGSRLPYWLLLSMQLAILALMARFSWRAQTGALIPKRKNGNVLVWFGWVYMLGSISRIAVGVLLPSAPAWFSTWIPAFFHVVLAGYVLTLSYYHLHLSGPIVQEK